MKKVQNIYYLDDDVDDLNFFKQIVEELGENVKVFSDARTFLLVLEMDAIRPDVIFLDVNMPILNGQEILEIIKKTDSLKEIPVVMVSGAYPKKLLQYCAKLEVSCVLKRHNLQEFKQNIAEVLKQFETIKLV